MYIPRSFWSDEMGDIDVIVHDDLIHVFYLCIPSHDRVAHIVSSDGLTWKQEKTAIVTGDPGEFDDDHIWTMGVFELNGKFFMLYTGLCTEERGKVQRVGLAVSDDLVHWQKHDSNPVIEADPRWYETLYDEKHRTNWRDPEVWVENGVAHGIICARSKDGPVNRRGCVGYFTSTDGYNWEVKPPLQALGNCYELETPAIFKVGERYYLTGINGQNFDRPAPNIYRVAESLTGPYRRTADDHLLPANNMVFKPCEWRGKTLLFHNLRGTGDWPGAEGLRLTSLAPPKLVEAADDGSLVLRSFDNWAVAASETWTSPALASEASNTDRVGTSNMVAMQMAQLQGEFADFEFEAEFSPESAKEFGVCFRADETGDEGSFVSCVPGRSHVALYTLKKRFKNEVADLTYAWRPRVTVQENYAEFSPGTPTRLRLVAYGKYVEFSVNGQVLLSAITCPRSCGTLALFAEDGAITVNHHRIRRLNPPSSSQS